MDTMITDYPLSGQALCRLDEIPDGGATAVDAVLPENAVEAELSSVIVLRRGEHVHAYLNVCPHAGRRLDYAPGKFLLKHDTLICAVHGATFKQADGVCIAGPCCGDQLRPVSVQVMDGVVWLAPTAA